MRLESGQPSISDVRHELQRELGAQEKLLWVSQPKQGLLLRASDIFLIPFSLLSGVPFVLMGHLYRARPGSGIGNIQQGVPATAISF